MKPNEAAGLNASALRRLTASIDAWVEAGRIAGAVVLIERRGACGLFEAIGRQDPARDLPMRTDTIFRIYSMTKPIVSVALMQFAERGAVLLRDPVAKYLPEFANPIVGIGGMAPKRALTVQDLLRHTAGLTYEFHEPSPVRQLYAQAKLYSRQRSNADHVAELARLPLAHEPGSVWDYSRATDVLGRLVEVLGGEPLGAVLKAQVFDPLGMVDTGFEVAAEQHQRLAEPLAAPPEGVPLVPVFDPRVPVPAQNGGGGLMSTAADYARFTRMLLNGGRLEGVRLLGRKTVEFMTADHLGPIPRANDLLPPGHGFGLGFAVKTALGEHTEPGSVGSYGWSGAAGTAFFVDPAEAMFAIVMTQSPGLLDDVRELFRQGVYAALD
ncbi:serine hydrolase [Rhizobacter sp. Root404]|uniref:serine hydrolase domain-containing protein n=1 Tax=Rhizobacter sp. Root404 TaxID=1736528 RepID=UPI0009E99354|nr:serine hydrolase domain-containing protein [Rhizobacter sp. Root404]